MALSSLTEEVECLRNEHSKSWDTYNKSIDNYEEVFLKLERAEKLKRTKMSEVACTELLFEKGLLTRTHELVSDIRKMKEGLANTEEEVTKLKIDCECFSHAMMYSVDYVLIGFLCSFSDCSGEQEKGKTRGIRTLRGGRTSASRAG